MVEKSPVRPMGREIKFRYWSALDNQWFYKTIQELQSETWPHIIDVEYQQYTGLKDKNGKEIYEGDIVKVRPNKAIGEVAWSNEGYWGVQLPNDRLVYGFAGGTDIKANTSEIIGNIYEHPHLLTQNKDKE